ncbi:uncharacterized protein TNCV_124101 [Trichonephila clavipes]|nr:uncharacterized protein TNCV_124101 [Trichonephila clavipes]
MVVDKHLGGPIIPPQRNRGKFQQLTEFERERIIGLLEGGFSYHAIEARVQRNSSTVMRVWKQWTDEHRTTGSGQRKAILARSDRYLVRMGVNDRTASFRQLAVRWSTAIGVLMPASSTSAAPWTACKDSFIQDLSQSQ